MSKNINEHDMSEFSDCLKYLKKVKNNINRNDLIIWLNENDVDYYHWTDLEMYIYYIEKNI
jgi:hypothetical protein